MEFKQTMKNQSPTQLTEQQLIDKMIFFPPNELVKREYSLDHKPIMKLITYQDIKKKQKELRYAYAPPKIKNQQFQKYAKQFSPKDFLGYNYADQLYHMVYFRYNNEGYNELIDEQSDITTKYFGGLFIPLATLESKSFKCRNNIFNGLGFSVPEIKDTAARSFGNNSKGCSFDPLFSSNFSSGNMMAAIRKTHFEYDIILQNDTNCKASEWFNFAVKFIEEGTYKFNIVNLSSENPLYRYGMKVPYYSFFQQNVKEGTSETLKAGEGWSFGGTNITCSKTQIRKQRQDQNSTYYCLSFQFKCNYRQYIAIFANSIPYSTIDYERFLNRVVYNKVGLYIKMEKLKICQTLAGTPLLGYLFYNRKLNPKTALLTGTSTQNPLQNQSPKIRRKSIHLTNSPGSSSGVHSATNQNSSAVKTIVIIARQHPGETSASFILEGVIEFIMDTTEFDSIKKNFQFVVVPFVNPDGVKYGNQRVNLAGSDSKRSWENPHPIFEPQVYHIKKLLKTIDQIHPISLVINLSSTNQNLYSYFKSCSTQKHCGEIPELFPYLVSKRVSQISFQNSEFSPLSKPSFAHTLSEVFPKSLVYDFKTSLYGWTTQSSGQKKQNKSIDSSNKLEQVHEFTPDIYRSIGKQFMITYLDYIRLCNKNIGVRERWMKQIEELSVKAHQQIRANQQKYQENWTKDLVKLNFPFFQEPPTPKTELKRTELRKHKSMIPYRNNEVLRKQLRQKSKKKSMQFMRNIIGVKDEKDNSTTKTFEPESLASSFDQLDKKKYSPSMNHLNKSLKSSMLFTQKNRKKLINQISSALRQPSFEKKVQMNEKLSSNKSSDNLLSLLRKKQKQGLIRKKKFNIKDFQLKDKLKGPI